MLWLSNKLFKDNAVIPLTVGQLYDAVVKPSDEK